MDDDPDFLETVIQNLEQKGILQKMRAQLRAQIYHLVDEGQDKNSNPSVPKPETDPHSSQNQTESDLTNLSSSVDDMIAISLVQDLLDCLNLSYTSSMFKSEIKNKGKNWTRRKIADVLQLELDEFDIANASNSSTRQEYSADTFNENSSGSLNGTDNGNTSTSADAKTDDLTKHELPVSKTPLLVEILRRLPKSTDAHSESGKSSPNETVGEVNNDTFVTANKTSDSF